MLSYIGIDASVSGTGLAIVDECGTLVFSNTYTAKVPKNPQWHDQANRIQLITDSIMTALYPYKIAGMCIESYAPAYVGSAIPIIELGGMLKVALLNRYGKTSTIRYVPPTVMKKFISGSGNSNKTIISSILAAKYGVQFKNDNESDALGLALIAAVAGNQILPKITKTQTDYLAGYLAKSTN